jgi:hypothetical protein
MTHNRQTIFEALGRHPIHPFPARMAPGIALAALAEAKAPLRVLDPMMGSGTVLAVARHHGHRGFGVDMDPLAVLLARVWTTPTDQAEIIEKGDQVLDRAKEIFSALTHRSAYPAGSSKETRKFIRYWFDERARRQLASLALAIHRVRSEPIKDALWCAFSRLIITKSSGASLAMDLSHSRPHKSFDRAPQKPFDAFSGAVAIVAKNCISSKTANRGPAAIVKLGAELIESWSKCFMFHKLAVEGIRSGKGAPVWLSDHKTTPTSSASIDRSSVDFEGGEMSFGIFRKDDRPAEAIMGQNDINDIDKLQMLHAALPGELFPDYVLDYISEDARLSDGSICFHPASEFGGKSRKYTEEEIRQIRRKKSIFANSEFNRGPRPDARHHLKIYYNQYGGARLFYKINGHSV